MFAQLQKLFFVLAVLGTFEFPEVTAHGNTGEWTITHDGNTQTMPGQAAGYDGKTAQRLKSADRKWSDMPLRQDDFNGQLIACNTEATESGETWEVDPGSTITAYWEHGTEFFPTGHAGVAIEYMARCPNNDCNGLKPMEAEWFKISETKTYEDEWAITKVIKDGAWPFKVPSDLKPGSYLLRHELLALHPVAGRKEFYPFCIQVKLGGSGTTVPDKTYKFPGIYTDFDQSYQDYIVHPNGLLAPDPSLPFTFPGPPLYNGNKDGGSNGASEASDSAGASGSNSGSAQTTASPSQPTAIIAAQESSISTGAYTAETTAASPSPSLDIKISNKQVDNPSNQDGAGNVETVEKTLPSAKPDNHQSPAASGSETGTGDKMSGSGVTTAVSPAATTGADTSNESGNSDYVSDVAGGDCQEGAWRCGSKDGKTIMERCQRIDQTQYGWNMSNPDCSRMCDVSDQAHPQCLG